MDPRTFAIACELGGFVHQLQRDSIPSRTPRQPLCFIKSTASLSTFAQRKSDIQLKTESTAIIMRKIHFVAERANIEAAARRWRVGERTYVV